MNQTAGPGSSEIFSLIIMPKMQQLGIFYLQKSNDDKILREASGENTLPVEVQG